VYCNILKVFWLNRNLIKIVELNIIDFTKEKALKKYCVIVNPVSGMGAGRKAIPKIEKYLQALGLDYDLLLTEYPCHAIDLAALAGSGGCSTVVAVGGDGTVNEVINGLMRALNLGSLSANLAVLPVGRGNDFSFGMGVPQNLAAACQMLVEGKLKTIDIGFVRGGDYPEGRYFGNGVGIGFDTIVGFEAAKLPSFLSGIPAYLIAAIKTIFLYFNAPLLRIHLDNTMIEQPCLLVSLMNGKRMGGSFLFAPDSSPDDGLLSLCIVKQLTRLQILGLFPKVIAGKHIHHQGVSMLNAQRVRLEALIGKMPVHADGETVCEAGQDLEVYILKKKLQMLSEESQC
jgi:YegS/Rv2252/BmrU family lipid kinase